MFVKKDHRKLAEVLYDERDARVIMRLGRREAEFNGSTAPLLEARHGPQLAALTELDLGSNKLYELAHFSTLASYAHSLKALDLSNNAISEIPSALGRCENLTTLLLEDNALAGILPDPITRLTRLRVLRLSGNKLTSIRNIERLIALEVLAVERNPLRALPPEVGSLERLELLLLRGCSLTELSPAACVLPALRKLVVSSNSLHALPSTIGRGCPRLEVLLAHGNRIMHLPSSLRHLTRLVRIDVSGNCISQLPHALLAAWATALPPDLLAKAETGGDIEEAAVDNDSFDRPVLHAPLTVQLEGNPLIFAAAAAPAHEADHALDDEGGLVAATRTGSGSEDSVTRDVKRPRAQP